MRVFSTSPDQLCKCLCVGLQEEQEEQSKKNSFESFFIFVCMKNRDSEMLKYC